MSNLLLILIIVLTLLLIFTATINITLRRYSRVRVLDILQRKNRVERMERLVDSQHELAMCMAVVRTSCTLAVVLLIHFAITETIFTSALWQYLTTFLVTLAIVIVFAVAIPSAWARYAGEPLLVFLLPGLFALRVVMLPVRAISGLFDTLVRRLAGVPHEDGDDELARHERELLQAVSEGKILGAVNEEEQEMIESIMEFRDSDVAEIMTPRTDIEAVEKHATLAELKALVSRNGHSRIPIYDDNIDNIVGIIFAKDLLRVKYDEPFDATEVMREALFVPETKNLRDLLHEFRTRKVHMAIVLDEYGGTAGLVTIEDILEELVGDIVDEYDVDEPEPLTRIDPHTVDIDARMRVDELNEELGVELPEEEDYETIAGLVFTTLGHIPQVGERCVHDNIEFEVIDAEPRRINRLRVHVHEATNTGEPHS
ncbi:MAG: HlyC/CorC family transporter [Phycisphaerales bacterium]|nr:HlyC/CorC family transporter [Phycisphaerales bacterium]